MAPYMCVHVCLFGGECMHSMCMSVSVCMCVCGWVHSMYMYVGVMYTVMLCSVCMCVHVQCVWVGVLKGNTVMWRMHLQLLCVVFDSKYPL